jgi:hypothetical protein
MQLDHNKTLFNCDLIEEEGPPSIPNTHLGALLLWEATFLTLLEISFCFIFQAQRCQFCIQGIYMLQQKKFLSKLQPPWWRRGIVSWHVVNKHKLFREASKHVKIEGSLLCFVFEKSGQEEKEVHTWSSFQTTLNTLSSLKQTLSTLLGVLSLFGTWKGKGRIYVYFPLSSLKNQRTYLDPWLAIFNNYWTWEKLRTFF